MSYHHGNLREALLDEAERVIVEEGLDAVKPTLLARSLGVSHNAPTRHFKDRRDFISALATRALEGLKAFVADAEKDFKGSRLEHLRLVVGSFVTYALQHPAHFVLLTHPELPRLTTPEFTQAHREYTDYVRACTVEAQREGWRSTASTDLLNLLNLSMALGLAVMGQYAARNHVQIELSPEEVAREAVKTYFEEN